MLNTLLAIIDREEDIKTLRKIFNNLPDGKLLPPGVTLKGDEISYARAYVQAKINELKGVS